jgi:hypothetical protein
MSQSLDTLPPEMLLGIFRQIQPLKLRVIMSNSRLNEVASPEFQALRSLRTASRTLSRPAYDALTAAVRSCDTLELDIFQLRNRTVPWRRASNVVFRSYKHFEITMPFHFRLEAGTFPENDDEITYANSLHVRTMRYSKDANGLWAVDSVTEKELLRPIIFNSPTGVMHPDDRRALGRRLITSTMVFFQDIRDRIAYHLNRTGRNLSTSRVRRILDNIDGICMNYQLHTPPHSQGWQLATPWASALDLYDELKSGVHDADIRRHDAYMGSRDRMNPANYRP